MPADSPVAQVEALFFDVFGTLMNWRDSVAREAERMLAPLGHKLDWLGFADAWRGEYQPGMEEVRSGRIPFSKLDVLHRRNLERILPRFGLTGLSGDVLRDLDRLQEVEIDKAGRRMTLRTPCTGVAGPLFKAARIALTPNIQEASAS